MAARKTDLPAPPAATADELSDRILAILHREVGRFERRRKELKVGEVDLLVRVLHAAAEVVRYQLDPFGPAGRRRIATMTPDEIAAARARLAGEGRPS